MNLDAMRIDGFEANSRPKMADPSEPPHRVPEDKRGLVRRRQRTLSATLKQLSLSLPRRIRQTANTMISSVREYSAGTPI